MRRGMQAYLIVRRSLRQRNVGPKQSEDRVSKLFGLLTEEQAARLEQGVLPDEDCLNGLARQLAESVDTVHQELTNFLYWLEGSPQIR
jgi:Tfp pilus assembly PilM family ATPase